jgi:chromate transporter
LAGLLVIVVRARPRGISGVAIVSILLATAVGVGLISYALPRIDTGQGGILLQVFLFFTKAGAFVFGSGLAIVPFLREGVVHQLGWLTERQFLDAVAVAMITPGPVVITVAFIGYLIHGASGATVAALGIFLPVYIFTIVPAPWFKRHQANPQLRAFVQGATAAATGAITGSVIVLGKRAIIDQPTIAGVIVATLIAIGALAVLWKFKVPEPVVIGVSAVVGLVLWPVIQ